MEMYKGIPLQLTRDWKSVRDKRRERGVKLQQIHALDNTPTLDNDLWLQHTRARTHTHAYVVHM